MDGEAEEQAGECRDDAGGKGNPFFVRRSLEVVKMVVNIIVTAFS